MGRKAGFKMSEEAKRKMSEAKKGKKYVLGRIWVNNGSKEKLVYPNNIPIGFTFGRVW